MLHKEDKMICSNCNSKNTEGQKFCMNCGKPLVTPAKSDLLSPVINQLPKQTQSPPASQIPVPPRPPMSVNQIPSSPPAPAGEIPSRPPTPEKKYFEDDKVLISNTKIVFGYNALSLSQIASRSYQIAQPVLARVFGILMLMMGCLFSSAYVVWTHGDYLLSGIYIFDASLLISDMSAARIAGFAVFFFFLIGVSLLFLPFKKYRINIYTARNSYIVVESKNRKYVETILTALNKALLDRGPYALPAEYSLPVAFIAKIIWAWIWFIISFVVPGAIALDEPEAGLGVGVVFQIISLVVSISLARNANPTAKTNGIVMITIWATLGCIGFATGFAAASG